MLVRLHHAKHANEDFKVLALPGLERMLSKEWDDRPIQIASLSHSERRPVAVIASHDSAAEEFLQCKEQLDVAFVLHDGEFGKHLAVHPQTGML
jgi:hypothetical protein